MRILGFVIFAGALHALLLALNPAGFRQQDHEILIGVALVEWQVNSFAAADSAGGQETLVESDNDQYVSGQVQETETVKRLEAEAFKEESSAGDTSAVLPEQPLPTPVDEPSSTVVPQAQPMIEPQIAVAAETSSAPTEPTEPEPSEMMVPPHRSVMSISPAQPAGHGVMTSLTLPAGTAVAPLKQSAPLQVSAQPRYGFNPAPAYPSIARRRGWEGTVEFNVQVLANGAVGDVQLKSSSGHKSLDDAARRAILKWRFNPATVAGQGRDSWVVVPVHFVLDGEGRSR